MKDPMQRSNSGPYLAMVYKKASSWCLRKLLVHNTKIYIKYDLYKLRWIASTFKTWHDRRYCSILNIAGKISVGILIGAA